MEYSDAGQEIADSPGQEKLTGSIDTETGRRILKKAELEAMEKKGFQRYRGGRRML
jgi:hypothetical protein